MNEFTNSKTFSNNLPSSQEYIVQNSKAKPQKQNSIENQSPKYKPPSQIALPLVIFEEGKFIIPEEAKKLLSQENYKNIGIISLVGKYRTGKSFLLNRVILNRNQKSGFGVGPTFKPCTKGIWIWSDPLIISNVHNPTPFPCFLIDTEGLGAYDEEINHDSKIFLIAVLISSLFIFNSFGAIDETAINSLSFVLNLSKTIKIKNSDKNNNENESELAQYFPTLLWLLRDFSLKLEDKNGNVITEKQYLENALEEINGTSDSIEEKNRVRNLIKTYFVEKDCFVMVRPVEKENDLQNLQNLPDEKLRKEFLEQSKIFRNKVFKKTKPKTFNKKPLTGAMLIELIQSILDSINKGSIPVIENSWKYVLQNEFIKNSKDIINKFVNEIKKYREDNKNNPDFMKNIKKYSRSTAQNYIKDFINNNILDEDNKKEFSEKLQSKINSELNKFDKENEKIFEEKFNKEINKLSEEFLSQFTNKENNIYKDNYSKFFEDIESFKEKANKLTPDFTNKNEIMFDKIITLMRKYFNEQIFRIKEENEKKIGLLNLEIDQYKDKIKELNEEISKNKEKNKNHFSKLTNDIINEKLKHRNIEEKMNNLLNSKKLDQENYQKQIDTIKNNYESKIKELILNKKKLEEELKTNNDEFLITKMNNEKITSLNEQKFIFLEKEINTWKEKYNNILKDSKIKENNYSQEIGGLREEIKKLKKEKDKNENINTDKLNNNLNDLMKYFKDNIKAQNEENKNMIQKILKEKENDNNNKEMFKNYNDIVMKNSDLQIKLNSSNFKITNLENKIESLNIYKIIVENTKMFKCKKCKKLFNYDDFKNHYSICDKNINDENDEMKSNENNYNGNNLLKSKNINGITSIDFINNDIIKFNPDKLKIKILKGTLKTDELGKPYIEYILDINYYSQNWRLNKKFIQFANLYKTIKTMFKNTITMPLSSNIFINFGSNFNGSFYQNKMQQLEKFIKEISEIEEINSSKIFRKFLEIDKNFDEENDLLFLKNNEKFRQTISSNNYYNNYIRGSGYNNYRYNEDENDEKEKNIK